MDKGFEEDLYNIVLKHITDDNFGAGQLSSVLNLSTSQTLKKVKAVTGKTVKQFIREVKLIEAAKLIENTDLSSAEIAFKVGFNSPSYFNKSFRKRYGVPPGGYKAQKSIQKEDDLKFSTDSGDQPNSYQINPRRGRLFTISSILILLVVTLAYFFYQDLDKKTIVKNSKPLIIDKSIAILPFKNLSSNKENEYFADGIMEVILNHLSKIKELKVISRTSMEQYRETTKTIPEIAKELGVSYILEGSVQKNKDEIRIITQLIDAKNDRHITSTDIKKDYTDIFELQSAIAKQISKDLNTEISVLEHNQINKKPTNNLEAYRLYLKGVHFLRNGSINSCVPFFVKAIELDPGFAVAYSELAVAQMYIMNRGTLTLTEDLKSIKELIQKSISLDPSNGQPHHLLALLLFRYDYNWKASEEEFLISLKLEPNNSFTHLLYSKFLNYTGRIEESREQIKIALELNPVFHGSYFASAEFYYYNGEYKKALAENKIGLELMINFSGSNFRNFEIYIAQKQYDKAIIELQKLYDEKESKEINTIYKQSGIKAIFNWLIKSHLKRENHNTAYYLAQNYAFLGEQDKALEQLNKSFEMKARQLCTMNRDPYFVNLRSLPKFKNILNKIGLGDNKLLDENVLNE